MELKAAAADDRNRNFARVGDSKFIDRATEDDDGTTELESRITSDSKIVGMQGCAAREEAEQFARRR